MDDVNRYDCVCDKGYWGTNCEKRIINEEGKEPSVEKLGRTLQMGFGDY